MSKSTNRGRIVWLMALEASSLAVMATLHLTGTLTDDGKSFDRAGIPEAVIGVALLAGAWRLAKGGWSGPLASLLFAIAGFVLGLTFTIPGGNAIEITYHVTVLPLLVLTLLLLLRSGGSDAAGGRGWPQVRSQASQAPGSP
jgi:peptidoglycan/LPS O-acetylase OafA/YrhL